MKKIKSALFFVAVMLIISACTQSEKSSDTAPETTQETKKEATKKKAKSDKKDKSAENESTESADENPAENDIQESSSQAQPSTVASNTASSTAASIAASSTAALQRAASEATYGNYLTDDSIEGPDEYDGGPRYYVASCEESITLRKSDSTKAAEITQIPLYSNVEFLGKASNGFYKVRYNALGYVGYVLSAYLDEYEPQVISGQTMTVIKAKKSVTLRTAPYTSAEEIEQIPVGTKVYFIEKKRDFYLVATMDGYIGYILSDYLRFN